jgi:hypothetical protein
VRVERERRASDLQLMRPFCEGFYPEMKQTSNESTHQTIILTTNQRHKKPILKRSHQSLEGLILSSKNCTESKRNRYTVVT